MQEEEKVQLVQQLTSLKETMKKLKSSLHSKQLIQEAQKKEMSQMVEKLKLEEQHRKSLNKVTNYKLLTIKFPNVILRILLF